MNHGITSPAYLASRAYREYNTSDFNFTQLVDMHLVGGYVVSTPAYFILARPVYTGAHEDLILDPAYTFDYINAWFIFLFAGDISRAWDYFPIALPYVGWQRNNRPIKFLPMLTVKRKVHHGI